ncbi:BatD family protein [Desulfobacula toluolica]|uniref:Tetratricopeptide and SH3 type3 domain protein n=1 Tax=Desulfobacula toluolica (strain DSM 7467 / Tol2) TaxID=651182 RepID=K0N6U1_DESTT|nr:BatD family protein [Desulfobacula toluolica]CCK79709.1 tetratricopeptide and SH3 type3 domain protein [Desulfobacula toluolica Tol2]
MKKTGNDMNLKRFFFIAIVLAVFIPSMVYGFDVTAHVDKTRISISDSVFLKVEVNGGQADLDLSMIRDFKVKSRGTSSSYNFINGRSERKATYQYVLIPLAKGELKIPAIKATQDGQTAFTRQIVIHVSDQVVKSDDDKALFAKAHVAQSSLFVGQQAVFTLRFFTSKLLSGLGFETPPEFNGFSSKPFEKEKTYNLNINGVLFQVTQVDYVIIPASPGNFTIDPAVLIANVVVKSNRDPRLDSFFNDSFFSSSRSKPVRVVSNPVEINVSPVPPYEGTGKFSGLVGRFEIEGTIDGTTDGKIDGITDGTTDVITDKTTLKAGESITLTIKISGSGNIMDASPPEIDLNTDAFKVYDDNPVENIQLTQDGYEGVKIFKKALVPVNPGKYVIKPVVLIYFDVDKKAYQTISTDQIHLDVRPSEQIHLAAAPLNLSQEKSVVKQEVSLINKDILEIKEGLEVLKDYRQIEPLFFILLLSIPAFLFSGVKLFVLVTKKDVSVEKLMEEKAKHHLKQAGKTDAGESQFLSHVYSALVAFILAKGKKRGETVTIQEARGILSDAHVDTASIEQVVELLDTIESVRFGGTKIHEIKPDALLSKTKQILKLFCLALFCMGLFSFVPQRAMADPATTFMDAVKNYKAGHFQQAAMQFETVAKNHIKNPYLFYNVANSYLKANDIGRAVLWYERALVLAPNDPDLRFNLEYANSLVKDKKESSVNIMDVLFFWDKLISVKTLQITSVFLSFVFFAWAAVRVVQQQKVFSGTGVFICSVFIIVTSITCVNFYKQSANLAAVIVADEVAVRSGVTDKSTKLFSLHAGTKVRVEEQRNGYVKIVFSKGMVGWIKVKQALII